MKKIIRYTLIIVIFLSMNSLAVEQKPYSNVMEKPREILIAEEFALEHNYSYNDYDCRYYTIDLYQRFLLNNITNVEPVIGYNQSEERGLAHAFIKVIYYIEPQTGKLVKFEKEYETIRNYDEVMKEYRENKGYLEVQK